ncbi:MAG: 30S ribosomal protein S16 [Candidatus Planktophila sp.]
MAVKIRLARHGKIRAPHYRIVVADSRTHRDGRVIEEIGRYVPTEHPSIIEVNSERAQYWLGVGAQPTEAVAALFKVTGDWQKFKGLPGAEGTLKVAAPKPAKSIAYEAAVKAAASEPAEGATTLKKKAQEKLAAKSAPAPEVVEAPVVEAVAEETPAVSEPATDNAVAGAVATDNAEVVETEAAVETPAETPAE